MSSYADPSNLASLDLAGSSTYWDSYLRHMLATSLVVHAVLLFGLMSQRLVPTIQQPIASYSVDLVALPESQVIYPKKESKSVKKVPVQPPVKSEPKPQAKTSVPPPKAEQTALPEPALVAVQPPLATKSLPTARITQSLVSAVDSVAFPQSREMTPIEKSPTLPPKTKLLTASEVENPAIPLPVVPRSPELPTLSTSAQKVSPSLMKSAPTGSMAKTLKQTMKSVTVPRKVPERQGPISIVAKPKAKPIVPSTKTRSTTFPKIVTLSQAPQLAEGVSVSKSEKTQPVPRTQSRVSDSLKQVAQSVIVPKVEKSTVSKSKHTSSVAVPVPSRQELKSSLLQKTPGIVPKPMKPDLSQQAIAKLVIPEVKELRMHHILSSQTGGGMKKTKTALQVSGISSEGNVYWARVWSKIDREWVAPEVAVRSGQPIHVLLEFRVERNGAVKKLTIEESSGNKYYDLAARRAVMDAVPLPAFPSDMTEPYYDIQFRFTVNLDSLS